MEAPSIQKSLSQNSALSVASTASSTESARKRNPSDFEFGEILGEGSYSTVLLATQSSNGKKYAVKVLDKFHIVKEKKVKYVTIEKDILQKLKHPLIVKLYYTFQDQASLFFVLEYCANGDLLGLIKSKGRFDLAGSKFYGAEILKGLQVIHENQILHRDLKPENILLNHKNHIKITDFGSAIMLDKLEKIEMNSIDQRRSSFVGTAEYCSPELLNEQKCTAASDIWAFACILFQMLVGIPPFAGSNEYQTFQKISSLKYKIPEEIDSISVSLISSILILDPTKRPSLSAIKNNMFFENVSFDSLESSEAPNIPSSSRLQQPDVPGESLEYFDVDFDETEAPYEREDKNLSSNDSIPNIDSWIPELTGTSISPSDIFRSSVVKIKNMFFSKTRGLLLTKTELIILDISKKKVLETFDLLTIKVNYISDDSFSVGSSKPIIFKDLSGTAKAWPNRNIVPEKAKEPIATTKNEELSFPSKGPWLANYFLFEFGNSTNDWKLNPTNHINDYFERFQDEILKFVGFISPDRREQALREQAFFRYKEIFQRSLKSDIEIFAFGSFATDLQIYSSDVDLAIIDRSGSVRSHEERTASRRTLKSVQKTLYRLSTVKNFNFISRAKIPIIKFVDRSSNLHFDISCQFNNKIVDAVKITKSLIEELPNLRPLVLVLKQYLSVRNLNNPATGGMGGYGLVLMVATFLKYHPILFDSQENNLGVLLLDFFHFFGFEFDYEKLALVPSGLPNNPSQFIVRKSEVGMENPHLNNVLVIVDPVDSTNNVTKAAGSIAAIAVGFKGAYETLVIEENWVAKYQGDSYVGYLSRIL